MSATVLPFRFCRRLPQIRRTAGYMVSLSDHHAEAHLAEQLKRLSSSLRRKGVAEDLIQTELANYEYAIRAQLLRLLLDEGDAA
ncbi:hypothetical protein DK419_16015 [Methylobacterium terrae]|uniref:Uncharacterized protein n=1 Tax=Methylobacterium terrae TaxID=2202827 RepID=A0A2U8WQ59_9HYPH|nr:DUF6074 family protein [Methylobacterium terrae]AWN47631.1 hypothetical protein DK419_16015 [Methylobacterium terrae]